jgi:multiple sugar transport system ATP-binding protein
VAKVVLENIYKSFTSRNSKTTDRATTTSETVTKTSSQLDSDRYSNLKSSHVNILRGINLTVEDGEFMVLVGPSGCGKSTLLRLIAGLEELTGGNIAVGDRLVNNLPPKARDIAMVFQNYALYPHLKVSDNIAFGLRRRNGGTGEQGSRGAGGQRGGGEEEQRSRGAEEQRGRGVKKKSSLVEDVLVGATRSLPKGLRYLSQKEKQIDRQVKNVAELLQIEPLLDRLPKELSGGQKQRVALGRAIARNPQVFLMDEPLSNLDAKLRAETRAQIVKLQRQLKTTTIYVTHDQTEAMTMGDRIAVMNKGEIQQLATPLEIYNYPANRFVAQFIGSPPMNFLSVNYSMPSSIAISNSNFSLNLPSSWDKYLKFYNGRSILLGIRPEHLNISNSAPENLQVQVDLVEALGNDTFISAHLIDNPNTCLQARIPPDRLVKIGESISLSLDMNKIHFFDPDTEKAIGRE